MNIKPQTICAHAKSVLTGKVNHRDLKEWIGHLVKMSPSSYLAYTSELSELMAMCFKGDVRIGPETFQAIAVRVNHDNISLQDITGNTYCPEWIPKQQMLKSIVSMEQTAQTHALWSSLMKMKTAIEPREGAVSRTKVKEHSKSIVDSYSGSLDLLKELKPTIRELTNKLVRHSGLDQDVVRRALLPMTHIPSSAKALHGSNGKRPLTQGRDQLDIFSIEDYMGCKLIQDIYYLNPTQFCERVFVGTRLVSGSVNMEEFPLTDFTPTFGEIAFIANPANKERVVDVPAIILQSLSYPIGKVFKALNSSWSVQGVDSHVNTCNHISQVLKTTNGSVSFDSVDLTNFTDRIPYRGLINEMVRELINCSALSQFDLKIMDLVAEGPILLDDKRCRYGVGIPMGTYPSFPSASLANGILATAAYMRAHDVDVESVHLNDLPFRIIGDDIVLWCPMTAQHYKDILQGLGMPVQPAKCISSPYVAEMCSKMITEHGVFEMRKLDKLYSDRNEKATLDLYSYYRQFSDSILNFLTPEEALLVDESLSIPEPYGLKPIEELSTYETTLLTLHKHYSELLGRSDITMSYQDWCLINSRSIQVLPRSLYVEIDNFYQDPFESDVRIPTEKSLCFQFLHSYKNLRKLVSDEELLSHVSQLTTEVIQLVGLTLSRSNYEIVTTDCHIDAKSEDIDNHELKLVSNIPAMALRLENLVLVSLLELKILDKCEERYHSIAHSVDCHQQIQQSMKCLHQHMKGETKLEEEKQRELNARLNRPKRKSKGYDR